MLFFFLLVFVFLCLDLLLATLAVEFDARLRNWLWPLLRLADVDARLETFPLGCGHEAALLRRPLFLRQVVVVDLLLVKTKRVMSLDRLYELFTYIIAERDKAFAGVVGIKSECLIKTSLLVGAGILRSDQIEIGQLKLIDRLLVAHLRE